MATRISGNDQSFAFVAQGDDYEGGEALFIEKIRVVGNANTVAGAQVEVRCAPYEAGDVVFETVASGAYFVAESSFSKLYCKTGLKAQVLGADLTVEITKKLL